MLKGYFYWEGEHKTKLFSETTELGSRLTTQESSSCFLRIQPYKILKLELTLKPKPSNNSFIIVLLNYLAAISHPFLSSFCASTTHLLNLGKTQAPQTPGTFSFQ